MLRLRLACRPNLPLWAPQSAFRSNQSIGMDAESTLTFTISPKSARGRVDMGGKMARILGVCQLLPLPTRVSTAAGLGYLGPQKWRQRPVHFHPNRGCGDECSMELRCTQYVDPRGPIGRSFSLARSRSRCCAASRLRTATRRSPEGERCCGPTAPKDHLDRARPPPSSELHAI